MIATGDRFVPADGIGDEIEVTRAPVGDGLAECRDARGLTFTVAPSLLLDERKWKLTSYMGTRAATAPLYREESADRALAALTVGMERKAAKWRPSLVPSGTMESIARAMQAGIDAGHVEGDWQQRDAHVFVEAAIRHLLAELGGERVDGSGLLALDHALASCAIARNLTAGGGA